MEQKQILKQEKSPLPHTIENAKAIDKQKVTPALQDINDILRGLYDDICSSLELNDFAKSKLQEVLGKETTALHDQIKDCILY